MALCIPSGFVRLILGVFFAHRLSWQLDKADERTLSVSNSTAAGCLLSDQPLQHSRSRKRPAVLVGDRPVDIALKEGEHGEPDASSPALLVGPSVSQGVVVQEESGSDVEGYEHVNGVVFMRSQDEEDAEEVEHPGQSVDKIPTSWSVCVNQRRKSVTEHFM